MTTTTTITTSSSPKCQCSADNLLSPPLLSLERQPPSFPLLHLRRLFRLRRLLTPRTHTGRQTIQSIYTNRTAAGRRITPSPSLRANEAAGATMGQQEELVAAVLKPPAAVVFSWEPVVAVTAKPAAAAEGRGDTTVVIMPPGSPTKTKAAPPAPVRLLSVPPPPGGAAARSLSSRAGGRAVRPEDDPFLAAYLACTKSSSRGGRDAGGTPREAKEGRSRFTWARLGLSCKSSAGVVERSMVKVAKRPELDPRDDA